MRPLKYEMLCLKLSLIRFKKIARQFKTWQSAIHEVLHSMQQKLPHKVLFLDFRYQRISSSRGWPCWNDQFPADWARSCRREAVTREGQKKFGTWSKVCGVIRSAIGCGKVYENSERASMPTERHLNDTLEHVYPPFYKHNTFPALKQIITTNSILDKQILMTIH